MDEVNNQSRKGGKMHKKKMYQKENFRSLVLSYAAELPEDCSEEMAERVLRAHAKEWGGCISCVHSRRHPDVTPQEKDFWLRRTCVLGLKQGTCGNHVPFPETEEA